MRSFVKYCFHHSKIKVISSRRRVISSIYNANSLKIPLNYVIFVSLVMFKLKALCNEFFDGEIFALRYSVLCTGSKDANRFPKLQVAQFIFICLQSRKFCHFLCEKNRPLDEGRKCSIP